MPGSESIKQISPKMQYFIGLLCVFLREKVCQNVTFQIFFWSETVLFSTSGSFGNFQISQCKSQTWGSSSHDQMLRIYEFLWCQTKDHRGSAKVHGLPFLNGLDIYFFQ